ncbi:MULTISPECIES: molecular chaperone HtpG [Pelosinus]|uniref:Chaperone protein HtpG n=1 Tax=Pelosinus fermentans B4 TaxID=1149862 RepID=I8RKK9_9FIRM|nr:MULTISPECIES: molecular chaperone HtpG [Pelosinus]EIW18945.1 heat shock protein Hsp90 [Pelosinus fermentans B4]EIW21844.1 Chaperone protein htpG [Pelosinus fermentans A11]OAM95305.1 Chaperone protein htpG [Pelosinus fermentans DSM 17108]SDR26181.1 molecular chaperone HtpG [Pelosinus fermentans]
MSQEPINKQTREFQAETKQLLDLMIHSIYTNKEIFLRELISNASDAIDKIRFESLTNHDLLEGQSDFEIFIVPDESTHTLTISDNGIGMTYDEVVENIGTIAKSGTKSFLEKLKEKETATDNELIGQFGVGFYSAFMVSDKVTLITRAPGQAKGVKWQSSGDGTYTIEEVEKETRGTTIIITLNDEFTTADGSKENFLDRYTIENLIKKYSDYIRYPIKMSFIKEEKPKDEEGKVIEDAPATQTVEVRTLNSMTPLWTRNKNDISAEEYHTFYKNLFHDWEDPLKLIHSKAEGTVEYTSLLFIPSRAPFDLYTQKSSSGIRLYSKQIFIMDNCQDLLPEYLRFVKGLVDSPDFSLNISRELLQHSKQLKLIGKNLEKSVLKTLENLLTNERPTYEKFWKEFGKALKVGAYTDFQSRDKLKDLLLFSSSHATEELTTLHDYIERMSENQKVIYYATGKDRASVERLPQMELLKEKGIEVLYLYDQVDEFTIDALQEYKEKKFQSISRGELNLDDIDSPEAKKDTEAILKENESLIKAIKEHLKGKIADVKISNRLKSSAVCLVSDDNGISLSMEQILSEMNNTMYKASRILELNPNHDVFTVLKDLHEATPDSEAFKDYCDLLYVQAMLIEGLLPEDPISFANKVSNLMARKDK